MPNHMHGIIIINKPYNNDIDNVTDNAGVGDDYSSHNFDVTNVSDSSDGSNVETGHALSLQPQSPDPFQQHGKSEPEKQPHPRFRNQGKNTISSMVGSYKSAVTKWCTENNLPFGWQSRFHDHIIRDSDEFHRIKNYIIDNPMNWEQDKFFNNNA